MLVFSVVPVPVRRPVDLGRHILRAIEKSEHLQKEVYGAMGLSASQWSNAIAGKPGYGIDLWKLVSVPWWFWKEFLPILGLAVMKVWIADIKGDLLRAERGEDME